jgi:hypothetical protein
MMATTTMFPEANGTNRTKTASYCATSRLMYQRKGVRRTEQADSENLTGRSHGPPKVQRADADHRLQKKRVRSIMALPECVLIIQAKIPRNR